MWMINSSPGREGMVQHTHDTQTSNPSNSRRKWVLALSWLCFFLQYSQLGNISVGPISYAEDEDGHLLPLVVCKRYYKRGTVEPSDDAYDIDAQLEQGVCVCVCVCGTHCMCFCSPFFILFSPKSTHFCFHRLFSISSQDAKPMENRKCFIFLSGVLQVSPWTGMFSNNLLTCHVTMS